jgi:hypothetical protein
MTADEIRKYIAYAQNRGNDKVGFDQEQHIRWQQVVMLSEIAAQLAEANEYLACLAHPLLTVVNAESPWVEFQFGGNRFNVDKSEVCGCRAARIGETQAVEISLRKGTSWCAEGTYAEVCAKLGIPVEG